MSSLDGSTFKLEDVYHPKREEIPAKSSFWKAFSIRYESMYYSVNLIHFSVQSFSPFFIFFHFTVSLVEFEISIFS